MTGLLIGTVRGVYNDAGEIVLDRGPVTHLSRRDGSWWCVEDGQRVWHDGEPIAEAGPDVRINCVAPSAGALWAGADRGRLFSIDGTLTEDAIFAGAPGRNTWHTPWGGPPDVRSISVGSDGALYVNVHVGGIVRYEDGALSPTVDITSDVHQVVAHPERPGTVVAATARGLARSTDGLNFEFIRAGLHAPYARAIAIDGDRLVMSTSRGPRGEDPRLYRAALDQGHLEPAMGGVEGVFSHNIDTHCLTTVSGRFYVGHGDSVWQSSDSGATWEIALGGLPTVTCLA